MMQGQQIDRSEQTQEKINPEKALTDFVAQRLPLIFPDILSEAVTVSLSKSQGFAGVAFIVESGAERYFLKVGQGSHHSVSGLAREAALAEAAYAGGSSLTVGALGGVRTVDNSDLPAAFENLPFPRGINASAIGSENLEFSLAPLLTAPDAVESIMDQEKQLSVVKQLGREVALVNSVKVQGFGMNYDLEARSFAIPTFEDYCAQGLAFNMKARSSITLDQCFAELREVINFTPIQVMSIEASLARLPRYALEPRLTHGDLNVKNYKEDEGNLAALLDFGMAGGRPWQHEVAKAVLQFTVSGYGISDAQARERASAFVQGYESVQGPISNADIEVVKDFYVADLLSTLHMFTVQFAPIGWTNGSLQDRAGLPLASVVAGQPDFGSIGTKSAREIDHLLQGHPLLGDAQRST